MALERIHYPDVFFASMASSGVFSGLVTDPNDPLAYSLGQWVSTSSCVFYPVFANHLSVQNSQVLQDASANGSAKIKSAIADVRDRMAAEKFNGLKDGLRCVYSSLQKVVSQH